MFVDNAESLARRSSNNDRNMREDIRIYQIPNVLMNQTLEIDSEILITMLGAFAQSESESISANVRWGIRQAMKEGKATIQYKYLYGYRKGDDGKPEIIPDQAEVVRKIYDLFLSGTPVRGIQEYLNANSVPNINGEPKWARSAIYSILTNEKYCGDVLLQKTYIDDCINKKVKKNTGQLPMYLVQNHHEGIISRETFDAAQAELARRSAGKSPSKKNAPTGRSRYSRSSRNHSERLRPRTRSLRRKRPNNRLVRTLSGSDMDRHARTALLLPERFRV